MGGASSVANRIHAAFSLHVFCVACLISGVQAYMSLYAEKGNKGARVRNEDGLPSDLSNHGSAQKPLILPVRQAQIREWIQAAYQGPHIA